MRRFGASPSAVTGRVQSICSLAFHCNSSWSLGFTGLPLCPAAGDTAWRSLTSGRREHCRKQARASHALAVQFGDVRCNKPRPEPLIKTARRAGRIQSPTPAIPAPLRIQANAGTARHYYQAQPKDDCTQRRKLTVQPFQLCPVLLPGKRFIAPARQFSKHVNF